MERDGGALVELLPLKVCYLLCAENGLTSGQLDTLVAASMAGDDYASLWRMAVNVNEKVSQALMKF